ncbi:hypothetical protein NN561_019332 [Cricetulus griseus]
MRTGVRAVDLPQVCPAPQPSWAQSGSCGTAQPLRSWKVTYRGLLTFSLGPCCLPSHRQLQAGAGQKVSSSNRSSDAWQIHARGFLASTRDSGRSRRGSDTAPTCTQRAAQPARATLQVIDSERSPLAASSGKAATGGKRSLVAFRIL